MRIALVASFALALANGPIGTLLPEGTGRVSASPLDGDASPVVVSDTMGRPWRTGVVDVAIGAGWNEPEYRAAGIAFGQPIFRGDNLKTNVGVVERIRREIAEPRGVAVIFDKPYKVAANDQGLETLTMVRGDGGDNTGSGKGGDGGAGHITGSTCLDGGFAEVHRLGKAAALDDAVRILSAGGARVLLTVPPFSGQALAGSTTSA